MAQAAQQPSSVSQIVEQVIEALSESISQLMVMVIALQEKNSQPPPQLPQGVGIVSNAAQVLSNVAKSLAETEYREYENIKHKIIAGAVNVDRAEAQLQSSLQELMATPDRAKGWTGLVHAVKEMSGETIRLLQIVYGADKERMYEAAERAKAALANVHGGDARTAPRDFAGAVSESATKAKQLAEYLRGKAQETEAPLQREQLLAMSRELDSGADKLIADANQLLRDPTNAALQRQVDDDVRHVNETIDAATRLLHDMDHEFDDAYSRFENSSASMERSLEELERAKLATYAEDILLAARKEKEAMGYLQEDLDEGDTAGAQESLQRTQEQNARLAKLVQLEANTTADPAKRQELLRLAQELERQMPAYSAAANRAIGAPQDAGARQALARQDQQLRHIIEQIEALVTNPGAEINAVARKEIEDIDKLNQAAKEQDARTLARAAKATVEDNRTLAALARAQASKVTDPVRRQQILDDVDELERLLPHTIVAAKNVVQNPDDAEARRLLDERSAALQAQVRAVADSAFPHPELALIEAIKRERELADQMNTGAKAGDARQVQRASPELLENAQTIAALSKQIATKFDDRARKARLLDVLGKLDGCSKALARDTAALAAQPGNAQLQQRVDRETADLNRFLDMILAETEAELFAEALRQRHDLHEMQNATSERDTKSLALAAQTVAKRQANLSAMAKASARRTEDPIRRKQLLDDVDELEMFMPEALAATNRALANPNDPEARRALHESVAHMDALIAGLMSPEEYRSDLHRRGKGSGQEHMADDLFRLQGMMPELVTAAEEFERNPANRGAQKRVVDILEALPLEALDSDETKLHNLIQEHHQALADLTAAAERGDKRAVAEASARLEDVNQRLLSHGRNLASKVDDDLRRKRMIDAIDELDMLVPNAIKSANAVANDPSNADKLQHLRTVVSQIHTNTGVLESLGVMPHELALMNAANSEKDALNRLRQAVRAGNVPGTDQALGDVSHYQERLVDNARAIAATVKDPALAKRLMDEITELERLLPIVTASSKQAAQNPRNAAMQKKAMDDIALLEAAIDAVVRDTRATPLGICQKEDLLLQSLEARVLANSPEAAVDVQELIATHNEMKNIIRAEAAKMKNPKSQQSIDAALREMDALLPQHIENAKAVLTNPNNDQARDNFQMSTKHMRAPLAQIMATLRPSDSNVADANSTREAALLARLREACGKGDVPGSDKLLQSIAPMNERIVNQARAAALNSLDSKTQARLNQAANELEQLHAQLRPIAEQARANPRNKQLQEKLASHTRKMEDAMDAISGIIGAPRSDSGDKARRMVSAMLTGARSGRIDSMRFANAARDLADYINGFGSGNLDQQIADLDKYTRGPDKRREVARDGDLDSLLALLNGIITGGGGQPKSWDEMIQAVANDVKRAAGSDDSDPIMMATRLVGIELAKIAQAAKAGDRQGLVNAGRAAAQAINQLMEQLRDMADRCKDPVTRDRLLRTIQALKTFSQQLKILAAVKAGAAVGEKDADTQGQLVAVTRSLGLCLTESIAIVKTIRGANLLRK